MLELGPTTLIQIVNFILLLFILKALLWKPLMAALEARQNKIETEVKEAEGINREARELKSRYEAQIAQARAEAAAITRDAQAAAEKMREEIIAKAKEEGGRIVRQSEREAGGQKDKAMAEARRHLADLTVAAAAKVLQDTLDQPTQDKLMTEFVRKVADTYVN